VITYYIFKMKTKQLKGDGVTLLNMYLLYSYMYTASRFGQVIERICLLYHLCVVLSSV